MTRSLNGECNDHSFKGVTGLHGAHVRLFPLVSAEHLGACLLGPYKRVTLHTALYLIERAAGRVVLHCHHRNCESVLHFGIGARGNHNSVPLVGPRSTLEAVTDILFAVAPAITVIVYGGNHGIFRCACGVEFHAHIVGGRVQLSRPLPCTVLDLLKAVCGILTALDRQQNCAAIGQLPCIAVFLECKAFHINYLDTHNITIVLYRIFSRIARE